MLSACLELSACVRYRAVPAISSSLENCLPLYILAGICRPRHSLAYTCLMHAIGLVLCILVCQQFCLFCICVPLYCLMPTVSFSFAACQLAFDLMLVLGLLPLVYCLFAITALCFCVQFALCLLFALLQLCVLLLIFAVALLLPCFTFMLFIWVFSFRLHSYIVTLLSP